MTTNIVTSNFDNSENQSSPFDAIRGYRADGSEFWTARELMRWLGYTRWEQGEKALQRAIKSLGNQGYVTADHVQGVLKDSRSNGLGVQEIKDFELSRLMCYMAAMNADPEKEMVALAQGYFASQTRKQEIAESIAPVVIERQLPPVRDSIDYLNASKILDAMPEGRLKQLLANKFTAEIALANVNQKQLGSAEPVKQYTTATVRASQLGFSATQIGSGSALGTHIKKEIKPEFSDWQGQFKVNHYEVTPQFDNCILAYFNQGN